MLLKLNERIQGVVAWVVIILIALTFTLFGVDYYIQSHQSNDTEVTVNGQAVSKQAFEVNYRRTRQQRDPAQLSAAGDVMLRKQVLHDMITNLVSVQGALAGGFDVSSKQADSAILSIPQFQQDGHFSQERYTQALSGAMFTHESFRKEVKQGMLLNQQRFAFIGSAFALESEIKRFVKLYLQTRDYAYLEIPAATFLNKDEISQSDISAYYNSHQNEFLTPELVTIDYVRLSLQQFKDKIKINNDEIQHYYDENQNNFLTPAQWKVAHILIGIPPGTDSEGINEIEQKANEASLALENNPTQFSQWVKIMSSDKPSIPQEGVLPWIRAGQTEFDPALATLTHTNQISKPIKTTHGFEIFKLLAYKPAKLKPLAVVKNQITQQLLTETAQSNYNNALEQLTDLSFQTPDSLQPVADALNLSLEKSETFSRQGGDTELTKSKDIINTAFSHDVLELGNNSEPIQLNSDGVIVLRVNKHIKATRQRLEQVKPLILDKLATIQAQAKAETWADNFLKTNKISQEKTAVTINNKLFTWQEVSESSRDNDKVDTTVNDLAFSLTEANNQNGRKLPNGDYALVRLVKINNGNYKTLDKEQQNSIAQQIESNYGLIDYELYINTLVKKAKIEQG